MWFIGVEVEQETSAPSPKKNPGSAPEIHYMVAWRYEISLLVLKNTSLDRWLTHEIFFKTQREILYLYAAI